MGQYSSGNDVAFDSGVTTASGDSSAEFTFGKGLESGSAIDNSNWNGTATSVWVKSCTNGTIFQGAYFGPAIVVDAAGKLSVWYSGTSASRLYASLSVNLKDGDWHHIVAQNNGVTTQLFIDGQLDGSRSENLFTLSGPNSSAKIYLGINLSNTKRLSGSIDNFQMYDDTLSNTQIQNLYSAGFVSTKNELISEYLDVFPNPTNQVLNLKNTSKSADFLSISDINGRVVLNMDDYHNNLDVSGLEAGTYFIRIYNSDKVELSRAKFIKL